MTQTNGVPQSTVALPAIDFERCDHCQAPLDARQRYCVACGARRPTGDDPVARWYADGRRARAAASGAGGGIGTGGESGAPAGRGGSGIATALVFALLPLAAAAGIYVGRGGDDQSELLVKALSAQKAPVVNIVGGAGGGTAAASDDTGSAGSGEADAKKDAAADRAERDERDGGRVIARTRYGDARQLTGARVTPRVREESKRALEKIADSKGKEYVESQRGLPDQIVIP